MDVDDGESDSDEELVFGDGNAEDEGLIYVFVGLFG